MPPIRQCETLYIQHEIQQKEVSYESFAGKKIDIETIKFRTVLNTYITQLSYIQLCSHGNETM